MMIETHYIVSDDDFLKISIWLENEVYPAAIEYQKETVPNPEQFMEDMWEMGMPYTGAVGGGLKYVFTPTGIGTCFEAVFEMGTFKMVLNLTNFNEW